MGQIMFKPTDENLRVSGGLTNVFIHCDACLSGEEFDRLRRHEITEDETRILHGQFSGSVSGLQAFSATAANGQSKQAKEQEAKERQTAQFVELVEQVRANIEQMKARIKALEEAFQKRDGDAWREKLALKILGEDDIPQQESGEDIETYRKRLEQHLINEMLNPDGTIKGKYKDDPKYGDYAEWAQKQYHLNNAKALVTELDDDNTSLQRREQILDEMQDRGYIEEMTYASKVANSSVTSQVSVRDTHDEFEDKAAERVISTDAAMKFNS